MKAKYLFRPIWRMFDFNGVTGRAEYFTYTVGSLLALAMLWFFALLFGILLPPQMLHDGTLPFDGKALFNFLMYGPYVAQLPMFALTVRRLRDQYASWSTGLWMLVPAVGAAVLFVYAFVPTFRDYPVKQPDGSVIMRSQQLTDRRFRNALIGAGVLVYGAATAAETMASSGGGMVLTGDTPRRKTKAGLFNADGTPNNRNSILARTRGHARADGTWVKGSQRKRTL
jgi:uncharacterized membrane protein YhaH (DUF805 family)